MALSCARRSLAAETIFMAFVICRVFFTLRMRRRRSSTFAMTGYALALAAAARSAAKRSLYSLMVFVMSAAAAIFFLVADQIIRFLVTFLLGIH